MILQAYPSILEVHRTMSNVPTKKRERVTFSQYSECAFIPRDDAKSNWYSSQEYRGFAQRLARDAKEMSRELRESSHAAISSERLGECMGLEAVLSQDLAMNLEKTKRAHVDIVLTEQCIQETQGVWDPDRLAHVSSKSSRWTQGRAHRLATYYREL